MEIQRSTAPLTIPSAPKNLHRLLAELQPGQSLDAVVTTKLAENSFVLKLADGLLLRAQTPSVLEMGQMLKLEVVKAGTVPELRIVVQQNTPPAEDAAITTALRQFLPKQQELADALVTLQRMAAQPGNTSNLKTAIDATLSALLPKVELMTADGLKRGVDNSGLFLEAKLAQALPIPQTDLKAQLLTLVEVLQQKITAGSHHQADFDMIQALTTSAAEAELGVLSDKALLGKVEGALARVVLDQLASVPEQDNQQVWRLEIPFRDERLADTVKLTVTRDGKAARSADEPANSWSVTLELKPPGMGTLYSRIVMVDEVVNTYFWSDRTETTTSVREHLDLLAARYAVAGLNVGLLDAFDGQPPGSQSADTVLFNKLRLDERA